MLSALVVSKKRLEICLEEFVDFLMSRKGESYYSRPISIVIMVFKPKWFGKKTAITYNVHFAQFHGSKSQDLPCAMGSSTREAAFGVSESHSLRRNGCPFFYFKMVSEEKHAWEDYPVVLEVTNF